jgi:hypothetical protein
LNIFLRSRPNYLQARKASQATAPKELRSPALMVLKAFGIVAVYPLKTMRNS